MALQFGYDHVNEVLIGSMIFIQLKASLPSQDRKVVGAGFRLIWLSALHHCVEPLNMENCLWSFSCSQCSAAPPQFTVRGQGSGVRGQSDLDVLYHLVWMRPVSSVLNGILDFFLLKIHTKKHKAYKEWVCMREKWGAEDLPGTPMVKTHKDTWGWIERHHKNGSW